ncbi:MAG: response regulator [Bacteroidota bacterium]|nr:response regulator [Bacteroidota bacterium]
MLKRILMLDDNLDILDIVKEALLYEHFEVRITSDGDNIIQAILSYEPDLVMLDYKLNGNSGDDICRQLKAHHQLNNIPVIICSAYLNKNDLLSCGCDAIITKPFGLEELVNTVNGLVYLEKSGSR